MKPERYGMVNGEIEIETTETCNKLTTTIKLNYLVCLFRLLFVNDVN